jgi:hypothetical protein
MQYSRQFWSFHFGFFLEWETFRCSNRNGKNSICYWYWTIILRFTARSWWRSAARLYKMSLENTATCVGHPSHNSTVMKSKLINDKTSLGTFLVLTVCKVSSCNNGCNSLLCCFSECRMSLVYGASSA